MLISMCEMSRTFVSFATYQHERKLVSRYLWDATRCLESYYYKKVCHTLCRASESRYISVPPRLITVTLKSAFFSPSSFFVQTLLLWEFLTITVINSFITVFKSQIRNSIDEEDRHKFIFAWQTSFTHRVFYYP